MLSASPFAAPVTEAVGNGPNYGGNETVNTSILHTYDEMVDYLKKQEAKQQDMELEVIGQSVKGRDLYLVKYMKNPREPDYSLSHTATRKRAVDDGRGTRIHQASGNWQNERRHGWREHFDCTNA